MESAQRRQLAPEKVIEACKTFICDACVESLKQQPSAPPVSLESIQAKWKRIHADLFEWLHPRLEERLKARMVIDEGCRVRVAKWLCRLEGTAAHRNLRWDELGGLYEERWLSDIGKPPRFKCDPEVACMDKAAALYIDRGSVHQEVSPGQARWCISIEEEAIRSTRATADAPRGHFFEPDFEELPCVGAQRVDMQALNGKNQTLKCVAPGTFVSYWKEKSEVRGACEGLARALAAAAARTAGGASWARILREIACAELMAGSGASARWTVSKAMGAPFSASTWASQGSTHEGEASWESAMGPPAKKAEVADEAPRVHIRGKARPAADGAPVAEGREEIAEKAKPNASCFWAKEETAIEVSVELPQQLKRLKAATRDMDSFVANQIKKGGREESGLTVTIEEPGRFANAEQVEVNSYIADVTVAFTQNRPTSRDNMWVIPAPELAKAMGVPEGAAAKLRQAVRGLVEAAIEWFLIVSEVVAEQGWARAKIDPCAWVLRGEDHGNDREHAQSSLETYLEASPVKADVAARRKAGAQLEARCDCKEWGHGTFYQTGVKIVQEMDKGFEMDHDECVKGIEEIYVSPQGENQKEFATTDAERELAVQQCAPRDREVINKLVDRVREQAGKGVMIHGRKGSDVLVPIAWADSSEANRPDGSSAKGLVMAMATLEIFGGSECDVARISWKSGKIDRMCSGYVLGNEIEVTAECGLAAACVAVKEKKVDVEAMAMMDESGQDGQGLLRVHDGAQLASCPTRGHGPRRLRLQCKCAARWKLVRDEEFRGARRRETEGVAPFDSGKVAQNGKVYDAGGQQDQPREELADDETEVETEEEIVKEEIRILENFPPCSW
ncbi:unnamed protein product [Prorocentrum cordatum]|uniref:Uncharacterized protein n=1 Tax=Prorocentrum cordatum TaxID=2364126 RepID=A0ABN9PYN6_9DINO|nr:unnamed protein product [Polarella glacialis]